MYILNDQITAYPNKCPEVVEWTFRQHSRESLSVLVQNQVHGYYYDLQVNRYNALSSTPEAVRIGDHLLCPLTKRIFNLLSIVGVTYINVHFEAVKIEKRSLHL